MCGGRPPGSQFALGGAQQAAGCAKCKHINLLPCPTPLRLPGCRDIRLLYETVQGPRRCSEREREKLVVALARAEVALQAAQTGQQVGWGWSEGSLGAYQVAA